MLLPQTLLVLMLSSLFIRPADSHAVDAVVDGSQRGDASAATSIAGFKQRVDEYVKLRKEVARKLPEVKETGDPAKISDRERALGRAIAMARASAKPGDIFGGIQPYLNRILAEDWNSRTEAEKKGLLEELPRDLKLTVNQSYPTTIPLVSVPGKLLEQLPMLPEEVEYRLVDRRLLLRDRDANLIIDVIAGAPPARDR